MIAALSRTLARRTPRERLLLAALVLLALPVAAVVLGILPLIAARDAARADLAEARAERAWYAARQVEIAALPVPGLVPGLEPGAGAPSEAREPVGLGGIEARLIDAGLRDGVSQLANAQGDSITLAFEAVGFEALMRWLDDLEPDAGYRVTALQVLRGDGEGLVEAELQLDPLP